MNISSESGKKISGIMLLLTAAVLLSAAVSPVAAADQKYIVMYIVGSDLESYSYAATDNLNDLLTNWKDTQGDLLVFYGGSNKIGWKDSIAVANMQNIAVDIADGEIGTDDGYSETKNVLFRINKEISSADALTECLRYADKYAADNGLTEADRYIIFWDHGGGYSGFGIDENTGKELEIKDISDAFAASGTRPYNILAFDACLMGSIEVADKLSPYANYMVASEELVAGMGYDYAAIGRALNLKPSITDEEMGRIISDAYVKQDDYQMTMSLVRMQKTKDLVSAIENLGRELYAVVDDYESLQAIGYIYTNTQGFGTYNADPSEIISMDVYEFAKMLTEYSDGSLKDAAQNVISAVDGFVIYATDDGYFSSAKGVSVAIPSEGFSDIPRNWIDLGGSNWYSYMNKYYTLAETDSVPHAAYTDDDSGDYYDTDSGDYADSDEYYDDYYDSRAAGSKSVTFTDTYGSYDAVCDYIYLDGDRYIRIGQVPLEEKMKNQTDGKYSDVWTSVPSGTYSIPEWDCRWFVLQSEGNAPITVSMEYGGTYTDDDNKPVYMYYIFGNLTRVVKGSPVTKPSYITVITDPSTMKVKDISVSSIENNGGKFDYWGNGSILKGDVFTPKITVYDPMTNSVSEIISDKSYTFGDNPLNALTVVKLDADKCTWLTEVIYWMKGQSYFFEPEGASSAANATTSKTTQTTQTATPKPTTSPMMPILSVIASVGAMAYVVHKKY